MNPVPEFGNGPQQGLALLLDINEERLVTGFDLIWCHLDCLFCYSNHILLLKVFWLGLCFAEWWFVKKLNSLLNFTKKVEIFVCIFFQLAKWLLTVLILCIKGERKEGDWSVAKNLLKPTDGGKVKVIPHDFISPW